ncbi:MAG: ribokinase [Proteobacteria bacterium]|nr:ribokinase [Pseudomonadota bacterium]
MKNLNISFPPDKPFDVVGLGLNSVDFITVVPAFPAPNSKMEMADFAHHGGGQVATAMVTCARLGLNAMYVGKVGDDPWGEISLESIRKDGVDVSAVTVQPGAANQFAVILVDRRSGERTILWRRDRNLLYGKDELSREAVCKGKVLHVDGHDLEATLTAVRWAKEEGIVTVMDADRVDDKTGELISQIDFLITSSTFPMRLTGVSDLGDALKALQEFCGGFLASTLGPDGAVALIDGSPVYYGGLQIEAVDTTGAGDVFHGAFIYGLLKGWNLDRIFTFSNAVAGLKCTRLGGRAIPSLEEISPYLSE